MEHNPLPLNNYFWVDWSSSFFSSFAQSWKVALCLIRGTVQVFTEKNRFFSFRWLLTSKVILFCYTSDTFLFIFSYIFRSSSNITTIIHKLFYTNSSFHIRKNIFACLFSVHNTISLSCDIALYGKSSISVF